MDNPTLIIIMRYIHIVSAITAVGGIMFCMLCLSPAVRLLDDGFRDSLLKLVHGRFLRVLWVCIAGLTISGVFAWMHWAPIYKDMGPLGNALIGTKVLLAVMMFAVVGARSIGMIKNPRVALMINIHLAAGVILIAAILNQYRVAHMTAAVGQ